MINNVHYNYIIIGKCKAEYTLLNENLIGFIYSAFSPLSAYTDIKKARISTIQYAKKEGDKYSTKTKTGRIKWDLSALQNLCTSYKNYLSGNFNFLNLKAEFPSITSMYEKGTTSEIIFEIENDGCYGRNFAEGECGIVLSIRDDIYEKAGEIIVEEFLRQIVSLLQECTVIFKKRGFFTDGKSGSMMDVNASRYTDPLYKSVYQDWEKLSL